MKILFLHGWQSVPGGVKPTFLAQHGHTVLNPKLPDEDFNEAVRIAQAEFDKHQPQVVVGSSRGGAVAMNINSGKAKLILLCPAWKRWGKVRTVKPGAVILHSRADDIVPFADSEELARTSEATLIEVGTDHRLADPEPLAAMSAAVALATPILCLGIDVAWWGGQRNKPESQRDTIVYTTINAGVAADLTFCPVSLSVAANPKGSDPTEPNYDADGSVLGILAVCLHSVGTVAARSAAVATSKRFQKTIILAVARIDATETCMAHHCLGACRHAQRQHTRHRFENDIRQPSLRFPAAHHRPREQCRHCGDQCRRWYYSSR